MNCRDCLDLLDGLEPGSPVPESCRSHAASCPSCALALRIEGSLRDAAAWAERPRMALESRAKVLGSARMGRLFWRQAAPLFEDAVVTSVTIFLVVVGLAFVAPSILTSVLPEPARRAAASVLHPLVAFLADLFQAFAPLVHAPWGIALAAMGVFSVLMAAVLSVRVLGPALRLR